MRLFSKKLLEEKCDWEFSTVDSRAVGFAVQKKFKARSRCGGIEVEFIEQLNWECVLKRGRAEVLFARLRANVRID